MTTLGLYLTRRPSAKPEGGFTQALGRGLLRAAPVLMKVLSVAGTAAMFLVGGGILVHGLPFLHHLLEGLPLGFVWDGLVGIVAGALVLAGVTGGAACCARCFEGKLAINKCLLSPCISAQAAPKSIATGLALAIAGAIAFSGKAIIVKLAYRYPGVDAVTPHHAAHA